MIWESEKRHFLTLDQATKHSSVLLTNLCTDKYNNLINEKVWFYKQVEIYLQAVLIIGEKRYCLSVA